MNKEEKENLFKHSETLKNHALELFDGQDSIHVVYGLLHAASQVLKERESDYKDAVIRCSCILFHLENCSGCEAHKEPDND